MPSFIDALLKRCDMLKINSSNDNSEHMSLNVSNPVLWKQPVSPHDHTFDGAVVHLDSDCDMPYYIWIKYTKSQRTLQHILT